MTRLLFVSILLLFVFRGTAQTVITCEDKNYAQKELVFYQYSDPVTAQAKEIFSLKFDANGKAKKQLKFTDTQFVFTNFGVYQGRLFLEPGKTVNIKMPPVREKSFADEKNPYFSPITFWFATSDPKDLNMRITDFTTKVNRFSDQHFQRLYFKQSRPTFDSLVSISTEGHINEANRFSQHVHMSLKKIEMEALRLPTNQVTSLLNTIQSQAWLDPAFLDLFNYAFSGQLGFLASERNGNVIQAAIAQSNLSDLRQQAQERLQLKGDLIDLALLKMLYDEYYSGRYSQNSILKLIKSPAFVQHKNPLVRETNTQVIQKLSLLKRGSIAKPICLEQLNGGKAWSDSNKEKFKYLIFADTEMIVCREHLKYLTDLNGKFNKHLEFIIVLRKGNLTEIKSFIESNSIPGTILLDNEGKTIGEYQVRSFPTCYLLDKQHKVVFENAKAPLEGFEQQFAPYLQQYLFQQMRNQYR